MITVEGDDMLDKGDHTLQGAVELVLQAVREFEPEDFARNKKEVKKIRHIRK